jgi:hypothetical protein
MLELKSKNACMTHKEGAPLLDSFAASYLGGSWVLLCHLRAWQGFMQLGHATHCQALHHDESLCVLDDLG